MFTRWLACPLSCLLLFSAAAYAQSGDISSPGRPDPSLVPISPPPAESDPNYRTARGSIKPADQEGKVQFRSQTILVQVPVVVTDQSGNHVHGLTKEAFHVFENGKEQKIATFEEMVATDKELRVSTPRPGEFSNLALSDRRPRAVSVIALDTINTPFLDQAKGRRELFKYLADNLDSGQVLGLMVITSEGVKVIHGLTDNREQLLQLLKKASGESPLLAGLSADTQANAAAGEIPANPTSADLSRPFAAAAKAMAHGDTLTAQLEQRNASDQTLNALLEIAWSLSGVPGRKSLIWASGGLPFTGGNPALYERTMQALDAAQISVYPVDVRGLVSDDAPANVIASTGQELAHQIGNRALLQQSVIDAFNEFADMTGGKAFYNTNDLATSFKRAADDATSYYLAGYYLDTHNKNAGWRELKIKVDKNNLEVRARGGFFVTNTTMDFDLTRSSDITYALNSPIESTGVPLSVRWLGASGDGAKKKTEFIIHVPAGGISIDGGNGHKHLNFEFAAAAYVNGRKTGKAALTTVRSFTTPVPETQIASVLANGFDMKNALELGPGQYVVRVVIRDNVSGVIGSVTAPLTVN